MTPERTNSYYQACQPCNNGGLSKIRLLIELCRIKGTSYGKGTIVYHDDKILAYLEEDLEALRVRYNYILVVSHGSADEDIFYDGDWWSEIEKHRAEIERLVKNGWKRQPVNDMNTVGLRPSL